MVKRKEVQYNRVKNSKRTVIPVKVKANTYTPNVSRRHPFSNGNRRK